MLQQHHLTHHISSFTAPSPIPAPTGRAISRTRIELEWNEPSQVKGILNPYRVTCFNLMQNVEPVSASTVDNKTTSVVVSNLQRNTRYKCVVEASTIAADGQDSKECTRLSASPYPIQTLDAGAFLFCRHNSPCQN